MSDNINHNNKVVLTEAFIKKANEFLGAEVFDPKTDIGKELKDQANGMDHRESWLSYAKDSIYGIRYTDDKLNNYEKIIKHDGSVFGYYCRPYSLSYGCTHEARFPIIKVDPKKMALFMVAVFGLDSMSEKIFINIKDDPKAMIGAIHLFEDVVETKTTTPAKIQSNVKTTGTIIRVTDSIQRISKKAQEKPPVQGGETGKVIPMSKP